MKALRTAMILVILSSTSCITAGKRFDGSYVFLSSEAKQHERHLSEPQQKSKDQAWQKIKIYYKERPEGKIQDMAIIEAFVSGSDVTLDDLFESLKKQAYLAGGDAIHKIEVSRYNQTGQAMAGTAVVFRSIDATQPAH